MAAPPPLLDNLRKLFSLERVTTDSEWGKHHLAILTEVQGAMQDDDRFGAVFVLDPIANGLEQARCGSKVADVMNICCGPAVLAYTKVATGCVVGGLPTGSGVSRTKSLAARPLIRISPASQEPGR